MTDRSWLACAPAVVIALGAAGCITGVHRHLDVERPVEAARQDVEARARELGLGVERRGGDVYVVAPAAPEPAAAMPAAAEGKPPRPPVRLSMRFQARSPGLTRIEAWDRAGLAERVLPGVGPAIEVEEGDAWSEWLGVGGQLAVGAGVGTDPAHAGLVGRVDLGARLNVRVRRFGAVDDRIASRWALISGLGLGVRFGPEGAAFRPELSISLERQRSGWFVPWWRLPAGPRTLIDLSVAGLIEEGGRRGFEVGVSVRRPPWVGFYARVGRLSASDTARGGTIWSAGVEGGTFPSMAVLVVGAVIGAAFAAVGDSITDGLRHTLGGD